jgi:multicomponent Na+:H+ antiporter subunit F
VSTFLLAAGSIVLAIVAFGLRRLLRGPGDADRIMALLLLGTGGIAALLLQGVATGMPGVIDVALSIALLAVFAAVAFARAAEAPADDASDEP